MSRAKRVDKDTQLGARFLEIRHALFPGQPRVQVGLALGGVSGGTVRNWELGRTPSPEALAALEGMGISLEYLLHGKGPMHLPPTVETQIEPETAGVQLAVLNPKLLARIIGANLRHIRRERFPHWGGQKKFADFLGISANDLCVYEYGRAVPNEPRLHEIAERLEMSVDDLCRPMDGVTIPEEDDDQRNQIRNTQVIRREEESELLDRIEELKREAAHLQGKVELLQELNAAQEERIRKLQEANYVLRDLIYASDSPEVQARREQLFSRISPAISDLVKHGDAF